MTIRSPKKHDRILDRFIPAKAFRSAYRIYRSPRSSGSSRHSPATSPHHDEEPHRIPGVIGFPLPRSGDMSTIGAIQDHSLLNLASTSMVDGITALGLNSSNLNHHAMDCEMDGHKGAIADALSLNYNHKVLKFAANDSRGSNGMIHEGSLNGGNNGDSSFTDGSIASIHQSLYNDDFSGNVNVNDTSLTTRYDSSPKSKQKPVKTLVPCDVFNAVGLGKDFYTSLVSWSKRTSTVAVGLAHQVCLWSSGDIVIIDATNTDDMVTSVGFSDDEYLVIGTKMGNIVLYSQRIPGIIDKSVIPAASLSAVEWLPNSSKHFITGDQVGQVFIFEIDFKKWNGMKLIKQFKSQQQQVCGISISGDSKQMAIGANDNSCILWDIEDLQNPVLKFNLPHQSAVKAIAYCPWSKSLLATGGGTHDRTIRFWHTKTGSLLQSYRTEGQITSLVWSRNKRQICATFGFCEGEGTFNDTLIGVYTYPEMKKVVQIGDHSNIRILSCSLSPDSTSICVTLTNDTIRFYEIWDANENIILDSAENGVLYSDLVELTEGINKSAGYIR